MNAHTPLLVIYNASAGSGKTTTLIREILKIILEGENGSFELRKIRQILGLTFTNAVANELKKRLVSVLFEIAKGDESQFERLKKIYFNNYSIGDDTIRQRAETILNYLLHHYSDLSLSTIDSFSNKILKSFAYDLNYSLVYNIATNTEDYYNKTIEKFLDELETTDNQRFQWIMEFIRDKIDTEESYSINQFIREIVSIIQLLIEKEISNEELIKLKDRLSKIDEEKLKKIYFKCKKFIKPKIEQFENTIRKKIEDVGKKHQWYRCVRERLVIEKLYDKIKDKGIENLNKVYKEPFFNFEILNNAEDFFYKRPKDYAENQREKDIDIIMDIYNFGKNLGYETIKRDYDSFNLFQQLLNRLLITRLAIELQDVLNALKKEENIVFFSDFTREINRVIQNEESVDFIFEKIGTRYRHFLIDEFQDTSTMQFNNLLPLIHNAMAEGKVNYIVGDPKQSIYMWRNANVHQFIDLAQHKVIALKKLQKDWEAFKSRIDSRSLKFNFRSAKNIVSFNNAVFDNLNYEGFDLISRVYVEAEQSASSNKDGYVEIIEYNCKFFKNKEQRQNEFINDVLEKINECIDLGYQQKDICVLLRSKNEINFLINQLSAKDLNNGEKLQFVAPEGLTIFQDEEVDFIIAFLEVLLNPNNKIANAVCWNYYLKKNKRLANDFYFNGKLDKLKENFIIHLLDENKGFANIYFNLSKIDVYQLCLQIIDYFNIPLNAAVQKLLNIANLFVHQYSMQGNTLDAFLDFWENNKHKFTIQVGKEVNAVKVYTIHKSKGLEFPVVITNINFKNKVEDNEFWYTMKDDFLIKLSIENDNIEIDDFKALTMYLPFKTIELLDDGFVQEKREEAHLEDINLIYVALTRAVNRLYIFGEVNNSRDSCKYYEKIILPKVKEICQIKEMNKKEQTNDNYKKIYCYGKFDEGPENKVVSTDTLSIDGLKLEYNSNVLLSNEANPFSDEVEIGIKVHKILEFVNNASDVEWALKKAIVKGLINNNEIEKYRKVFNELVHHSELSKYFDSNNIQYVFNELEIYVENDEVYRPDKMLFTKQDEIVIFEFKTGKNLSVYKNQLSQYVNVVQSLHKDKIVVGYLIYLNNESVVCEKVEQKN